MPAVAEYKHLVRTYRAQRVDRDVCAEVTFSLSAPSPVSLVRRHE